MGTYYVEVDAENRVVKHDTSKLVTSWIEIDKPDDMFVDLVDHTYLYSEITNTIEEVPFDYFSSNRAKIAKITKVESISNLTVITSTGKVFDGDEASQDRMVRAISIAGIVGQTTTNWKLADNTTVEVTLAELQEALALSGQAMSDIWLAE